MNKLLSRLIIIACVLGISYQVQAKNAMKNNNKPPPRPSFSSLDINSDSDMDFEEFSAHTLPFGDHQTVFDKIDTDNNGVISQAEYENHKPPRPKKNKERV